ncbi:MAG: hypothetical protein JXO51_11300 [Candidatus Aminicenantes bacterium]|nr:hypothetical protein [Candidatus Aminicenantes bacterium]
MKEKTPIFFIVFSLLIYSLPAGVTVSKANKDYAQPSPQVTLLGQIAIGENGLTLDEAMANQFFPRFVFSADSPPGWFLSTSKRLVAFDTEALKTAVTLPVREVDQVLYRFPGTDECLVSHWIENKRQISRCHFPSGKITWSMESDFVLRFMRVQVNSLTIAGNTTTTTTVYYYPFPIRFTHLAEKNQLFLSGLIVRGSAKFRLFSSASQLDWGIRNRLLDATTGEIVQDTEFDLQKDISDSLKLFVSLARCEFQVMDLSNAGVKMAGKFTVSDMLAKKDFAPPIDMRQREDFAWRSDVHPVLTRNGLILCSHWEQRKAFKVVSSDGIWLKYDLDGSFKEKISPAPITFIEKALRNQGTNRWPMVFRTGRGKDGLAIFYQDGTLSTAPVPEIKGYPDESFHDDHHLFTLVKNTLYRTRIGESTADPIYTAPKGKKFNHAPFGANGMVVLSGSKSSVLVRLSDGKEIDPQKDISSLSAELFWSVADTPRLKGKLPEENLPLRFKHYQDFDAFIPEQATVELYQKDNIRALRLWGKSKLKDQGDIVLVPGLIKGGGAIMVGIGLPENRVLFCLPMARLEGLSSKQFPNEPGLIYGVAILDQQNALLVVADDLNTYNVYRITRPTL